MQIFGKILCNLYNTYKAFMEVCWSSLDINVRYKERKKSVIVMQSFKIIHVIASENLRRSGKEARTQKNDRRARKEGKKGSNRAGQQHTSGDINQPLDYATLIYRRCWTRSLDVSSLFLSRVLCDVRKSRTHVSV